MITINLLTFSHNFVCHTLTRYITISLSSLANCIGDVMVSVIASSAVDRGFELRSGQTKNYKNLYVLLLR